MTEIVIDGCHRVSVVGEPSVRLRIANCEEVVITDRAPGPTPVMVVGVDPAPVRRSDG